MKFLFSASPSLTRNYCSTLSCTHATYANPLSASLVEKQRCISPPRSCSSAILHLPLHNPLHTHYCSQSSPSYRQIRPCTWSLLFAAIWLLLRSQVYGAQINIWYFFVAYSGIEIWKKMKKMPKKSIYVKDLRLNQQLFPKHIKSSSFLEATWRGKICHVHQWCEWADDWPSFPWVPVMLGPLQPKQSWVGWEKRRWLFCSACRDSCLDSRTVVTHLSQIIYDMMVSSVCSGADYQPHDSANRNLCIMCQCISCPCLQHRTTADCRFGLRCWAVGWSVVMDGFLAAQLSYRESCSLLPSTQQLPASLLSCSSIQPVLGMPWFTGMIKIAISDECSLTHLWYSPQMMRGFGSI